MTRVSGHIYTPNIPADSSGVFWEVVLGKIDCASVAVSLLVGGGGGYICGLVPRRVAHWGDAPVFLDTVIVGIDCY